MKMLSKNASFGQQIALALAVIALLGVVSNVIAVFALRSVVDAKDQVITQNAETLIAIETGRVARERRAKHVRSFVITGNDKFAKQMADARDELLASIEQLTARAETDKERALVRQVELGNQEMQVAWDKLIDMVRSHASQETVVTYFEQQSKGAVANLDKAFVTLSEYERERLAEAQAAASRNAEKVVETLVLSGIATAGLALGLALWLSGALRRRIGAAVQGVQSSSTELEAAAHQQVSSTQELTSTTNEITVTIRELLATARQIAESAQRVVHIAEETGDSARVGDATVQRTQEAIGRIKGQVDQIVNRMIDLGRKSQQIGGILELINELAEQTNILSINATIEAAGAGEAGKRFAVVADEIRRLADRVSGSAREIRALIDEIRAAANATVMATEDGSKSVEVGARQFSEVLSTFKGITDRVAGTTDAAREIELSTKQLSTAVEQLNVAIGGVAQAARETQTSSSQTLATCSELANVSRGLSSMIREVSHGHVA
ncbi:MAG: methyl-accepting chemotaxis protein [Myxococcales bacterium]